MKNVTSMDKDVSKKNNLMSDWKIIRDYCKAILWSGDILKPVHRYSLLLYCIFIMNVLSNGYNGFTCPANSHEIDSNNQLTHLENSMRMMQVFTLDLST